MMKMVLSETELQSKLNHPNIAKVYDANINSSIKRPNGNEIPVFYILMEYIECGDLFDFIALSGKFNEDTTRYYFSQLLSGIEYLHSNGLVHRDIKAENLLLDSHFNLKIIDFGFTAPKLGKDNSGYLYTWLGTVGYMAPEIHRKMYEGEKVDIFAMGVLLFIMAAANHPFKAAIKEDIYYRPFIN